MPEVFRQGAYSEFSKSLETLPRPLLTDKNAQLYAMGSGIAIHFLVNIGKLQPSHLPANLVELWRNSCNRLGRISSHLSYLDIVLFNFKSQGLKTGAPEEFQKFELLFPTTGCHSERNFYLNQLCITFQGRKLPLLLSRVIAALEQGDLEGCDRCYSEASLVVESLSQTLALLTPNPSAPWSVDPISWSKYVAPMAVTIDSSGIPGPSGTSNPLIHVLDILVARGNYNSFLGAESLSMRNKSFPANWRNFLFEMETRLNRFLLANQKLMISNGFVSLRNAYSGDEGLLSKHRKKVAAFLSIAFRAGRAETIGGFIGSRGSEEWMRVDDELEHSRQNRCGIDASNTGLASKVGDEEWSLSRFFTSDGAEKGYRFILNRRVIHLSNHFVHPGGTNILSLHHKCDVSEILKRIGHLSDNGIEKSLLAAVKGTVSLRIPEKAVALLSTLQSLCNVLMHERERIEKLIMGNGGNPSCYFVADLRSSVQACVCEFDRVLGTEAEELRFSVQGASELSQSVQRVLTEKIKLAQKAPRSRCPLQFSSTVLLLLENSILELANGFDQIFYKTNKQQRSSQ